MSALSKTDICNLALLHDGVNVPIGNVDTEVSEEAQLCRTVYPIALNTVLEDFPWLFAKKIDISLALVHDFTKDAPPTSGVGPTWWYSYRYPSDCLHLIKINSYRLNNDTRQSRVEYTLAQDSQGLLVYTNLQNAAVEYIFLNSSISQYQDTFVLALSYKIAEFIAPSITGGDPFGLGKQAAANYSTTKEKSACKSLNEEQRPEEPQSEFIRARNSEFDGAVGVPWSPLVDGFTVQ